MTPKTSQEIAESLVSKAANACTPLDVLELYTFENGIRNSIPLPEMIDTLRAANGILFNYTPEHLDNVSQTSCGSDLRAALAKLKERGLEL